MPDDPKKLDEEDEERTSISIDLTPPPTKSLDDDEEESTKVLDWDRAMKKSLEEKTPPKK
jgi:hypothetical protein